MVAPVIDADPCGQILERNGVSPFGGGSPTAVVGEIRQVVVRSILVGVVRSAPGLAGRSGSHGIQFKRLLVGEILAEIQIERLVGSVAFGREKFMVAAACIALDLLDYIEIAKIHVGSFIIYPSREHCVGVVHVGVFQREVVAEIPCCRRLAYLVAVDCIFPADKLSLDISRLLCPSMPSVAII